MAQLPNLTEEDLAKIEKLKGIDKNVDVSPEMYFLAQFGLLFGWEAVVALETGVISLPHAIELVQAAQKVRYAQIYEEALAMFYSTKDSATFNKGMKTFVNKSKVVE